MICKICKSWFEPYQIIDEQIVVDAYICYDCLIQEAELMGYRGLYQKVSEINGN